MRYTVGEEVLFIYIEFTMENLRFGSRYFPWCDKLVAIHIKKLKCRTHHKVPSAYGDREKLDCDGFVFTETIDGQDVRYYNQYPTAYYGQIDDSNDWNVRDPNQNGWVQYTDITKYLLEVYKGYTKFLRDAQEKCADTLESNYQINPLEIEYRAKTLESHYQDIVKLVREQGYDVNVQPVVFRQDDGTEISYPDILEVVLTKIEKDQSGEMVL